MPAAIDSCLSACSGPAGPACDQRSAIMIVDDDQSVRLALDSLLRGFGHEVFAYGTADAFLEDELPDCPSCIMLDLRLPGCSGIDIQAELNRRGIGIPVVFLSGHGDVPIAARAMKAGATDFLTKPFTREAILQTVTVALERDRLRRQVQGELSVLIERADTLSPRERQVMILATDGLLNKQIAAHLGLSEVTVKIHRHNAMRKMQARSLAALVRMVEALRRHPSGAPRLVG